ncbi:MAG TPA: hypothetical protein P5148_19455, partial [Anaerolineae bacterium]|nr:hypothetical protein [Anaerolineae bacterium]
MNWPGRLQQASFVRRDNRFRAWVLRDGELISAHVPNSGRLGELLTPGAAVWIRRHDRSERKTASDLVMVAHAGVLVSIDARPIGPATYRVYGDNGKTRHEISPAAHAQTMVHAGAGEIGGGVGGG